MFGNDKQDQQTQVNDQTGASDAALSEPSMGQPFNVTSPDPVPPVAAVEPTSAPMPNDAGVTDETGSIDQPPVSNIGASGDEVSAPAVETPTDTSSTDTGDLTSIKHQALQQLSPLVDQLEQTPEEKFRTTMMMIQAADNQSLIKTAYDAAQEIKDEKLRAQALLDVINEINYFTQQKKDD